MPEWVKQILKTVKNYDLILVILVNYVLSLVLFRFDGLMNFYDLITVPYVYNYTDESEVWPYNFLRSLGFTPGLITSLIFQLSFTVAGSLTYFSLKKILPLLTCKLQINSWLIFVIALFYAYNPWTFERFLMGQYKILAGYALLVWGIYELLRFFTQTKLNLSQSSLWQYLRIGLVIGFVSYVGSIHFGGFLFMYLGIFLIAQLWQVVREKEFRPKQLFAVILILVISVLPAAGLLLSKYYDNQQFDFYQDSLTIDQETRQEIIRSFQIRIHQDGQDLYVRTLIGSASWMDSLEQFMLQPTRDELGGLANFLYYFNEWLSVIVIVIFLVWLGHFAIKFRKTEPKARPWIASFFVFALISLILNFGYSGGFEVLNQWFYKLPFSYTYREAGKFFGLFLASILILLAFDFSYEKYWINKSRQLATQLMASMFLFFLFLSNYFLFVPANKVIEPTIFPEVITNTEKRCNEKSQVLFLPFSTHAIADYNKVPHLNPIKYLLNCPVVQAEFASLNKYDSDQNVTFAQNQIAEQLGNVVSQTVETKDLTKFLNFAKEKQVGIVILNTYPSKKVRDLNVILIQKDWEYYRNGTNYIYYLPDFE